MRMYIYCITGQCQFLQYKKFAQKVLLNFLSPLLLTMVMPHNFGKLGEQFVNKESLREAQLFQK